MKATAVLSSLIWTSFLYINPHVGWLVRLLVGWLVRLLVGWLVRPLEVGIYKRKQESKTRKHAFHQERDQEKKKKNTLTTKTAIKKKQ